MNLIMEEDIRASVVKRVAEEMLTAARTAPKARGKDNLVLAIATGKQIMDIAARMDAIGKRLEEENFFSRDAECIRQSAAVVLMGTKISSQGLKLCGRCGFANCDEKDLKPDVPCTFNAGDLGIAIGSAVSVAMDRRIDNRIMYTVGQAVLELKLMGDGVKIAFGIPLSVSAKSPFFDRK